MHALRKILREHEAFAIVATHSPVVVQESLARHVSIVRREGDMNAIVPLTGETFGESIGLISAEVFDLQTDTTDFHNILDRLIQGCSESSKRLKSCIQWCHESPSTSVRYGPTEHFQAGLEKCGT